MIQQWNISRVNLMTITMELNLSGITTLVLFNRMCSSNPMYYQYRPTYIANFKMVLAFHKMRKQT